MSYHIVYKRQFVDVGDGRYLAMILSGDNNVYEPVSNRRCRNWDAYHSTSFTLPALTEDEIMKGCDKLIKESVYHEFFKWNGKFVGKNIKGFFKNGIKEAVTIEDLISNNIVLSARISQWEKVEGRAYGKQSQVGKTVYFHTTDELFEFLDYANSLLEEAKSNEILQHYFISFSFPSENCTDIFRKRRSKSEKQLNGEFFILEGRGYVHKLTKKSLYYCHYLEDAKLFKSELEADKWYDKYINDRFTLSTPLSLSKVCVDDNKRTLLDKSMKVYGGVNNA